MTPQLYILARKIHRLMVIVISVLSLVMMVTGLNMKYGWFFIDAGVSQEIHGILSPYFAVVLAANIITGFYMYLYIQPRKGNVNKPS